MKRILIVALALVVSGCGGGGGPTVTDSPAPAPISVSGDAATGASQPVAFAAGSYEVRWNVDDGSDTGCTFSLYVATTAAGPVVASIVTAIAPTSKGVASRDNVTIGAGTYLLQEDRSGLLSCARSWSAVIVAQ